MFFFWLYLGMSLSQLGYFVYKYSRLNPKQKKALKSFIKEYSNVFLALENLIGPGFSLLIVISLQWIIPRYLPEISLMDSLEQSVALTIGFMALIALVGGYLLYNASKEFKTINQVFQKVEKYIHYFLWFQKLKQYHTSLNFYFFLKLPLEKMGLNQLFKGVMLKGDKQIAKEVRNQYQILIKSIVQILLLQVVLITAAIVHNVLLQRL